VLFELANRVNAGDKTLATQLRGLGGVLGLLQREPMHFLQVRPAGVTEEWIRGKITEREAARHRKDYAAADRIRQELSDSGIAVEDKGGKTIWRRL
jgi:cysteinyl-tRNA synthetase